MAYHKVLVVDDSRVSRMLVRTIIEYADKEISIIDASNAEEAFSKIEGVNDITMAIVDLNMPGIDGLVLATKLLEYFPTLKIGLLTANVQDIVRNKAESLGISFIPKPITEEKILAFIQ
ncbi:MAG: response regulator [Thiomargarita sp.]|nr:response regulator [Thiomargarita sp.]